MNQQPFHHEAEVYFTATRPVSADEIRQALDIGLGAILANEYIAGTAECHDSEDEAGDPADLM